MSDIQDPELGIRRRILALQDARYRDFIVKLIPSIPAQRVIGVRTPMLRRLARDGYLKERAATFLEMLPHAYYEEDMLHAFLIEQVTDYDEALACINRFLPFVDNWATCDSLVPRALMQQPDNFYEEIKRWMGDSHPYIKRFGIVRLMGSFLDERFKSEMLSLVCGIVSEEYYVNMAIAWYLSMSLVKQYPLTLPILQSGEQGKFVHNKTIQKAIESRCISPERKDLLRGLRRS
jgi:3-methyladenine DNA glycosylase AlkD